MALEYPDVELIMAVIKNRGAGAGGKLLILGDAEILISVEEFLALSKKMDFKLAVIPKEMTPFTFGQAIGFSEAETLDINGRASITLDLQEDIPSHLMEKFDSLIDAGVLFWCFEPGKALKNIYRLVAPGGLIFHVTAISGFYGRGFYNIHPRLFDDFYINNGCLFLMASYRARLSGWRRKAYKVLDFILGSTSLNFINYSTDFGHIYLKEANAKGVSFGSNLKKPESYILPNNALGVFAFEKKYSNKIPVQPCLK